MYQESRFISPPIEVGEFLASFVKGIYLGLAQTAKRL